MSELRIDKRVGMEEVVRRMSAAAILVEAPSGGSLLVNGRSRRVIERGLGRCLSPESRSVRDLHDSGDFEMLHPDGRPYELEEWPLIRSIASQLRALVFAVRHGLVEIR